MVSPVKDPELLRKLNGSTSQRVTDPELLRQLNGEDEMTWGEVGSGVVKNFGSNAADYGGAMADMVMNPIDSFMAITKFLGGGLQELVPESVVQALGEDKEGRAMFNGFVDGIKRDYGSMEGFKRALAERPVETMSDVSILFNAAGLTKKLATAGAKAGVKAAPMALPAVPQQVSSVAQKAGSAADKVIRAGEMLDPLTAAGRTVKGAAGVAGGAISTPSGAGTTALREAFESGLEGGERASDFRRGMRDSVNTGAEAVELAKAQVAQMRQQASAAYRQRMAEVGRSSEVLDFKGIDEALDAAAPRTNYKGVQIDDAAAEALNKVREKVAQWKQLDPAEFHTAEGFDKLKQVVSGIRESLPYGTNARHTLDGIYNAIKQDIIDKAPIYADAMKGYEKGMDLIKEFERTLSTKPNASIDTTLRKLQSTMRDGVATNYGARTKLAEEGAKYGKDWRPMVAGQSLSSWMPRGAAQIGRGLSGPGTAAGAAVLATGSPLAAAVAIPSAALGSARFMGEAAHKAGQLASAPLKAAKGAKKAIEAGNDAMKALEGPFGLPAQQTGLLEFITDPVLRNLMYQSLYGNGGVYEQ